jgi:hypothetical protein
VLAGAFGSGCSDDSTVTASGQPATESSSASSAASAQPTSPAPSSTTPSSSTPTSIIPTTSTFSTPETTLADIVVPDGVLAAIPYQDRKDVAKSIFQVKIINGTEERIDVVGVQFVWDGFGTDMTPRDSTAITPQRRIDLPLPLAPATCAGDGTAATMPDPASGVARLQLTDGSVREVPVFDTFHVARRLYLADCERQLIERMVTIEWVNVAPGELDGHPVSNAELRVTRGEATGDVSIWSVSNTINYSITVPERPKGQPLVVLPAGEPDASIAVQIIEGRCDAHALSESSQPFNFVVQLDLGDGMIRPLIVLPAVDVQPGIRERTEAACLSLNKLTTADGVITSTSAP